MPLPIRDGNQSLTTLSTLVVDSAHVPAHTVVSLGSQTITDIATAVSGVELGPNTLNALENISVTMGLVTITGGLTDAQLRASSVTIGGSVQVSNLPATQTVTFSQAPVTFGTAVVTGSTSILNFPATQTVTFSQASVTFGQVQGSVTATISGTPSVTFGQASVTFGTPTVTGEVSILNFPATQAVTFGQTTVTGTVELGPTSLNALESITVTMGQVTVTGGLTDAQLRASAVTASISNFPATQTVAGTVTVGSMPISAFPSELLSGGDLFKVDLSGIGETDPAPWLKFGGGNVPVAGTVTANVPNLAIKAVGDDASVFNVQVGGVDVGGYSYAIPLSDAGLSVLASGTVTVGNSVTIGSLPAISGTVTASIVGSVTVGSMPAISGTVTANVDETSLVNAFEGYASSYGNQFPVGIDQTNFGDVPISGTVTANVPLNDDTYAGNQGIRVVGNGSDGALRIGGIDPNTGGQLNMEEGGGIPVFALNQQALPISGTVTGNGLFFDGTSYIPTPFRVTEDGELYTLSSIASPIPAGTNHIGSVTVGNSVTIGSLPAISGTVTANNSVLSDVLEYDGNNFFLSVGGRSAGGNTNFPILVNGTVTVGSSITIGSLPAISGTVTANLNDPTNSVIVNQIGDALFGSDQLTNALNSQLLLQNNVPISGTVTADSNRGNVSEASTKTITTGGTHQQVFASKANRKFLLVQNVSDTDMNLGIGYNPSATTGIFLGKNGSGIVFESSFIPTQEIRILCASTGKAFVALEG